jgi:hypothetical protein
VTPGADPPGIVEAGYDAVAHRSLELARQALWALCRREA